MDEELKKRLDGQDQLLRHIYSSAEKTRKYFKWTMIVAIALFVLPLLASLIVIPKLMSTFLGAYSGLGL